MHLTDIAMSSLSVGIAEALRTENEQKMQYETLRVNVLNINFQQ